MSPKSRIFGTPRTSLDVRRHRRAVDEDQVVAACAQLASMRALSSRRIEIAEATTASSSAAARPCAATARLVRRRSRRAFGAMLARGLRPSSPRSASARARRPSPRWPCSLQVPDHVERPDLAAALRRKRQPVADEQDLHAATTPCSSSATSAALAAVEIHAAPDLEVDQRRAGDRCRPRVLLLVLRDDGAATAAGSNRPRAYDRLPATARRAAAARARPAATRPSACRSRASSRSRMSSGSTSASARFIDVLELAAAHLERPGHARRRARRARWSSNGTRHSSDTAMLILSVSISRSSGNCVCEIDVHELPVADRRRLRVGETRARCRSSIAAGWAAQQRCAARRRRTPARRAIALVERQRVGRARKPLARRIAFSSGECRSLGSSFAERRDDACAQPRGNAVDRALR